MCTESRFLLVKVPMESMEPAVLPSLSFQKSMSKLVGDIHSFTLMCEKKGSQGSHDGLNKSVTA